MSACRRYSQSVAPDSSESANKTAFCCTGGYTCWAEVHEHGCYSDHGVCTSPEEHVNA